MVGERFSRFTAAFSLILFCTISLMLSSPAAAQQQKTAESDSVHKQARTLIHLLDYMATDYSGAVQNGKIINKMEYREMREFTHSIDTLYQALNLPQNNPNATSASQNVQSLKQQVLDKANPEQIASLTSNIKQSIIQITGLTVAPSRWPSIEHGRTIFEKQCVSCHGAKGDGNGKLAASLDPKPTNFHDTVRMQKISPFQAYNTIKLGVEGTSMPSFSSLSEQEAWDLSFYIKSIQYQDEQKATADQVKSWLEDSGLSLADISRMNDKELKQKLVATGHGSMSEKTIAQLRQYEPEQKGNYLQTASNMMDKMLQQYRDGQYQTAYKTAISAYLEGFEPVESQLKAHDGELVSTIEGQMMGMRSLVKNRAPEEKVSQSVAEIKANLSSARSLLDDSETTPFISYVLSASILLREGLEAFLIIITILGVLTSLEARREKIWVHAGWVLAVILGGVAWFFTDWLVSFGANWRELMEGGFSLLAVIILIYVGFWMHRNSEVHHWKKFINEQVKAKLQGGNLIGLATVAFIAVFREAFESVIFLSAISIETGPGGQTAIAFGSLTAFVALIILGVVMLKFSAKLPLRSIFRYGSFAIGAFSLIMVGQGIHAVQESGFLSVSPSPIPIEAGIIGIYPTMETLVAQLVTFGVLFILWKYSKSS